jgi:eukaryotic-like serine/threonine-protein kinase
MDTLPWTEAAASRAAGPGTAGFSVGGWLIEPDLCRASRDGECVHLRPQLMDLLVYLVRQAGRTVPQEELLAAIWPEQPFLADTALPRCIAELRHALGDSAGNPSMILTIYKRGYRLIAPVGPVEDLRG